MIKGIAHETIWRLADTGVNWFHHRATVVDGTVLMTLQAVTGSDVFGPVHDTVTLDGGCTWSEPRPIASLGRIDRGSGFQDGVCDVVPEFHPQTGTVLAMGHTVHYQDDVLTMPYTDRRIVYATRDVSGAWSGRRYLEWDNPDASGMHSCGCGQRLTLDDGDVLLPMHFLPEGRADFAVTTARCSYDGREVKIIDTGAVLRLPVKRGLFESSLARFGGRFLLTMRAEDDRGHVATSTDGLSWGEPAEWRWDDGAPLTMSSTQQHWLTHSAALFLIYTRKADDNTEVLRWRSPLFVARVDIDRLCLIRDSERVVLPLSGNAVGDGRPAAGMGNFHVTNVSQSESWITVGEEGVYRNGHGDTLLARIHWSIPNRLVA